MINLNDVKMVHVEASSRCNSRCPMCSRYDALGFTQSGLKEDNLSFNLFAKLFTGEFCSQLEHVYFSGVYGDPCINPNLPKMVSWLLDNNCKGVSIDTNGGYRAASYWKSLARPSVLINFSIDGTDNETLGKYRIGVSYEKVMKNLKAYVEEGGNAQWNFIVFKHNEHQVEHARQIADDLGIKFRIKVTQKFKKNKSFKVMKDGEHLYDLEPPDNEIYRHPNIGTSDHQPIKFSGLKLETFKDYSKKKILCSSKIKSEIFLSSSGLLFPCCYLGTNVHDSPGSHQFVKNYDMENFDLKEHEVAVILGKFLEIESKWDQTIEEGNLITCYNTCGFDNKNTLYYTEKLTKQEIIER